MEYLSQRVKGLRNLFGRDTLMLPCVGKKAVIKWKNRTAESMSDPDYLQNLDHFNIAIVNGEKSNGLCCIDVDEESFIEVLMEKNPFLKNTTKTKGKSGMHFWFRLKGHCPKTRYLNHKGQAVGEFRSTGGITIIAGKHPDGGWYKVKNRVEPIEISFDELWLPTSSEIELTDDTERTDENRRGVVSVSVCEKLLSEEGVITQALPYSPHNNHHCLFKLARGVKGLEWQNNRTYSDQEKRGMFDQWHGKNSFLREGQSKEEYYFEYLESMEGVIHPLGQEDVMELALKRAQANPYPEESSGFEDKRMKLLLSLCRELQLLSEGKPFFLSCRKAAELIGHSGYKTVNRWLRGFELSKLLEVVRRGGPSSNKANRYRYLGQLNTLKA